MKSGLWLMRVGFALVLAVAAVWVLMHRQMIDVGTIEPLLRALGIWAPVGFVLVYATGTVLLFSGALLGCLGWQVVLCSARSGALSGTYLGPRWVRRSPSCWPAALPESG